MYKILIVEDDRGIAKGMQNLLSTWDLEAKIVTDFRQVMQIFSDYAPHLVLLDISLPFYNGFYWCQKIREVSKTPIIFISSAADNMNIVMAVNMGGDDFITKPFDANVLVAKVQAMLRRTYDFNAGAPIIEHRGAIFNTGDNTLVYEGNTITLTKNEYRILLCLLKNKGNVVTREDLMMALWETDDFIDENTLTVNVNRLRKKLDQWGLHDFITTKFGVGYIIQ